MTAEEYKQQAEELREQLLHRLHGYLGDNDVAEDIVQDTMLKLWLMRDKLHGPLRGIGSVIARNLCIDYLRRQKPTVGISRLAEEEDLSDEGEDIEQMMQIIDTLPSTQRTILRMRHLQGMEMREIAMVLGSTEVAVRKTLSRARRVVRRKLIAWLAAACLVTGISMVAVHWLAVAPEEECVAFVYGTECTDEATVMAELKRTMGEITEDNPQDEIENQLNELFGN